MGPAEAEDRAHALRRQIATAEIELTALKQQLLSIEGKTDDRLDDTNTKHHETAGANVSTASEKDDHATLEGSKWPMALNEYKRYGRQMIVPDIGLEGRLLKTVFSCALFADYDLRTSTPQICFCPLSRSWRLGMSGRCIYCRRWCWYYWNCRWRYC